MLLGRYSLVMYDGIGRNMGQFGQGLILLGIFIELRKAFKENLVAGGPQFVLAAFNDDGHVFRFDRFHLAGQKTVPNQGIEAQLVPRQEVRNLIGRQFQRRRANGFVGILTGLLGLVGPRLFRDVFGTVVGRNEIPRGLDHVVVDTDRVGTHVGDETDVALVTHIEAFIELLGQHHRLLGTKIEFTDAFLLHRRRRKRRLRLTFTLAFFDFDDFIGVPGLTAAFPTEVVGDGLGLVFMLDFSFLPSIFVSSVGRVKPSSV